MCVHCCCLQTLLKRASDSITDGCMPPCGCWGLNSGPLEEQSVLLSIEVSLRPKLTSKKATILFTSLYHKDTILMDVQQQSCHPLYEA